MERIVSRKQQITQGANIRDGKKEFLCENIYFFPKNTSKCKKFCIFFAKKLIKILVINLIVYICSAISIL